MKFVRNDPALKERRRELRRNQTEAEIALWKHLRGKQIQGMKFFRQYSVGNYILDFYSPSIGIAIELDGGQHNDDQQRLADSMRRKYLKDQGIDVLRFWNHEVLQHIDVVLAAISE